MIKNFPTLYKFCNGDLNNFILLLQKDVYPYEDMDSWEKFDETTIPPKEAFYSTLILIDISDEYYEHVKKVCDVFEKKIAVNIMTYTFKVIHYCLQMCLKTLEMCFLKYMNFIQLIFCLHQD